MKRFNKNTKWWNTFWGDIALKITAYIVVILMFAVPIMTLSYTQRYITNNNGTATKGVWLQKTIYLKEYKHLGKGNGIFGDYARYSRSDRHEDVLTIYFE